MNGKHFLETAMILSDRFTEECRARLIRVHVPYILGTTDAEREVLKAMLPANLRAEVDGLEPREPPHQWLWHADLTDGVFAGRANFMVNTVIGGAGARAGYLLFFAPDISPSVLNLLVRGDRSMHARMATLVEPRPRPAAILYADLYRSGALSRRMSSEAYFRLISALRSGYDYEVRRSGGVLGKHAGDGVTALYLAEQLGSNSSAVYAAVRTARGIHAVTARVTEQLAAEGIPVDAERCRVRVGLHWGGTLFIGQISTDGRLEITALGDEMNEAARIEQTAEAGRTLASKALLEQLSASDARELGLPVRDFTYELVTHVRGASEKASQDAGFIAVTNIC
jgi:class 3 adenylate cyclase